MLLWGQLPVHNAYQAAFLPSDELALSPTCCEEACLFKTYVDLFHGMHICNAEPAIKLEQVLALLVCWFGSGIHLHARSWAVQALCLIWETAHRPILLQGRAPSAPGLGSSVKLSTVV